MAFATTTIERVRRICLALAEVTEDVKWGNDLCFCVEKKMFAAMDLDPPYSLAFKCTPEKFAELVERPGIIPAPYMARNMWVQEQELGSVLERTELERLLRTSYELVIARLPKSRRPGATPAKKAATARNARGRSRKKAASRTRRRR
jgi:predicted DNA-binding protein (MmcQ/YjbR family)